MENKLSLQELAERLARKENVAKKDAETFSRTFFEIIEQGLTEDKFVKVKGFGTFKLVAVGERESVDVNTGERIQISGHSKITFTPDNLLKDLVNRPFSHFQTVIINDETNLEEMERIDTTEAEEAEDNADTSIAVPLTPDTVPPEEDTEDGNDADTNEELPDEKTAEPEPEESTEEPALPDTQPEETAEQPETLPETEGIISNSPATAEAPQECAEKTTGVLPSEETSEHHTDISQQESSSATPETVLSPVHEASENAGSHTEAATVSEKSGEEEKRNGTNWWKVTALILLTLILMGLSYFAGYFRILCPCELWPELFQSSVTQPATGTDSVPQRKKLEKSTPIPHQAIPETDKDTANRHSTTTDNAVANAPSAKTENNTPKAAEKKKAKKETAQQAVPGKYRIVGTRQSYTIARGETIRTIAEYVYGSKGYAPYIIRHNNLRNPDNVAAGTVILLPELERNTP